MWAVPRLSAPASLLPPVGSVCSAAARGPWSCDGGVLQRWTAGGVAVCSGGGAYTSVCVSTLLQWTVGVGYTKADYQAAVTLNDQQNGGW